MPLKDAVARQAYNKAYLKAYRARPEYRERQKIRMSIWLLTNRQKQRDRRRACELKKQYGMSIKDYETKVTNQRGLCAICDLPESRKQHGKTQRLAIDHNHQTGQIRDLLCDRCNYVLGMVQEDPDLLDKMISYLAKHAVLEMDGKVCQAD